MSWQVNLKKYGSTLGTVTDDDILELALMRRRLSYEENVVNEKSSAQKFALFASS